MNQNFITWVVALMAPLVGSGPVDAYRTVEHLVVSEVIYNPLGTDTGREWIEVFNGTGGTVSLDGYRVGDEETQGEGEGMYSFPLGSVMLDQTVAVVAASGLAFYTEFGFYPDFEFSSTVTEVPDMVSDPTWAGGSVTLSNTGDEVLILYFDGAIYQEIDRTAWGSNPGGMTCPLIAEGSSYERCPVDQDTDTCGVDFVVQTDPATTVGNFRYDCGTPVPSTTPTVTSTPSSPTPTDTPTPSSPVPTTTPTDSPTQPTTTQTPPSATPTASPVPSNTPIPASSTPTAEATETPIMLTPTPVCHFYGVTITMPSHFFRLNQQCWLNAEVCNPGPTSHAQVYLFVILEVYGSYFFYPLWTQDLQYSVINDFIPGYHQVIEAIPTFNWPPGTGYADRLLFIGGLTDPGITNLIGNLAIWEFGYDS